MIDLKRCEIATAVESVERPPGVVEKVIRGGYIWGDITLLPAEVLATKEPAAIAQAPRPATQSTETQIAPAETGNKPEGDRR